MNVFGLYSLSYGKFFFDPIYQMLVVWPLLGLAGWRPGSISTSSTAWSTSVGRLPKLLGAALRPPQNGLVQFYALAMMLGLLVLMGAMLM